MTNEQNSFTSRTIAPRLIRLNNHPWSWVRLGDLTALFGLSVPAIWEHYCSDARMSVLQTDWSGRNWKFARSFRGHPADGVRHEIHDVWDMRSGERCPVPEEQLDDVLIPAGWSKTRTKTADELERAVTGLITEAAEGFSPGNWPRMKAVGKRWQPTVASALQSVDTFCNLELALAQIKSAPDGLNVSCKGDDENSSMKVSFQHRGWSYPVVVLNVRLVLGKLKLLDLHVSEFDNEFRD